MGLHLQLKSGKSAAWEVRVVCYVVFQHRRNCGCNSAVVKRLSTPSKRESPLYSDFNGLVPRPRGRLGRVFHGGAACAIVLALASCSAPLPNESASAAVEVTSAEADYSGAPARVRRMSAEQYENTIAYVFGDDIRVGAPFAPLRRTDGLLASGAATAGVTLGELQQIQRSAASIAAQVIDKGTAERPSRRDFLIPCKPNDLTAADDACAAEFIKSTGRLLYRRPLSEDRVAEFVNDAHAGAEELEDFYAGLALVIEGMLIDPKVIFVTDTTEPDPNNPGQRRLDAYALASRLSFFLWDAAPDDTLLKAAESGEILTKEGRTRLVDMMLASPRLETGVRAFFDDMFGFDDFGNLAKDPSIYPMITGTTLMDAREQTLRTVIDHLLTDKGDYRDLYTTRETFMSPALATVYQVPTEPGWVPYEFPEGSPRTGLLTQISFLTVHAHPGRSSPTLRGKALRELLLCQPVPPPPPNVNFSEIENPESEYKTQRDRVNAHLANPVCAGCHKITDPMGLALEAFDGAGRYRETEKGNLIDTSGSLDGTSFDSVLGLSKALRDHPALPSCLVNRLYSYGTGGPMSRDGREALAVLSDRFAQVNYRVPDLLRMIATSDAFIEVVETPALSAAAANTVHGSSPQTAAARQ